MSEGARPAGWFLVGATAVGKSAVAQYIAETHGWRILSADSMLVYRGMDVGTAKATAAERMRVPYYGVDLTEPDNVFSVAAWLLEARRAWAEPPAAAPVLVVGGTGLYLRCLVEGLQAGPPPDAGARARWQALFESGGVESLREALRVKAPAVLDALADGHNPRRLVRALERVEAGGGSVDGWSPRPSHVPFVGLRLPPEAHHSAIESRVRAMYDGGLVEELARLTAGGRPLPAAARHAIGYAEAADFLAGRCSRESAMERTVIRTRQYAKRQRTWFARQASVRWIEVTPGMPVARVADAVMAAWAELGPLPVAEGLT